MGMRTLLVAAGLALAAVLPQAALAQADTWPSRPIRFIVPYGAGNQADVVARVLADALNRKWGQSIVVENAAGAGGSIGVAQIARAAPDGYTMGIVAIAAVAITPHMQRTAYDPLKDLTPLAGAAVSTSGVFVVNAALPARDFKEFLALARSRSANPLLYYTSGNGTVPHLNMEILRRELEFPATHVPYRTSMAGTTDLISGQVQMALDSLTVQRPQIEAGRVRVLFTSAPKRLPQLPDVPTLRELAPNLDLPNAWMSIHAPRGLPAALLQKMSADIGAVVADPEFARKLPAGSDPLPMSAAEVSRRVAEDHARFGKLVKELGLKTD